MTITECNICYLEFQTKKRCMDHCVDDHLLSDRVDHNQCDYCFKRFRTALGFHRHYTSYCKVRP